MTQRLAVDIGGTFVDAVGYDVENGTLRLEKDFTTPGNIAAGVTAAIRRLNLSGEEVDLFIHGTTLGLNTVLQGAGACTGILTNAGFEDVFEMGRYARHRSQMYSLDYDVPELLVPKRRRVGVTGRINAAGEVLEPLDADDVRNAAQTLIDRWDVQSIAICFLHAYKNPIHEREAAAIIRERWPEIAVSISSDIVREYREYERTSTTVVNAYIKPVFDRYVTVLRDTLTSESFGGDFYITRSGGGAMSAADAAETPVHTIISGPAGGIIGAARLSEVIGVSDLLAVDMGGTSTDACVIQDGAPSLKFEASLEHLPLMIPTYDIATIGAGGGSIARVESGLLKVGPQSAGAEPGPICYGRGGTKPTFTDAALVLGYIDPEQFLGGEVTLDLEAAATALQDQISRPLGLSNVEAARGIFDVLLAKTVSALREITIEKGLDPRDFSVLSYGGAGGLFAPLVAREIEAKGLVVPQAPSVFSAWGMLMTDLVQEYALTVVGIIDDLGMQTILDETKPLREQAQSDLTAAGFPSTQQDIELEAALRYFGQEHTLEVPLYESDEINDLRIRFDDVHKRRYGHVMDDAVQLVHLRVRGIGKTKRPSLLTIDRRTDGAPNPRTRRQAYCFAERALVEFAVYTRESLLSGDHLEGPLIVEEPTTTIVCFSDQVVNVDDYGHLLMSPRNAQ